MSRTIFPTVAFVLLLSLTTTAWAQMGEASDTTLANAYFAKAEKLLKAAQDDSSFFYYEKASSIYGKAVARYNERPLWEKHIRCLNFVGYKLWRNLEYDKAMSYLKTALEIGLKKFGESHPEVATSYNNIANIHADRGEFLQAKQYYEKALTIRLRLFGEIHPEVAWSYGRFGILHYLQADYDMAIKYHNKSLAILSQIPGENYLKVAHAYNIGSSLEFVGRI